MGWELRSLSIDDNAGLARVFHFELVFQTGSHARESVFSGDGVLLRTGKVYFNREDELCRLIQQVGINPQNFLEYFGDLVAGESLKRIPRPV